MRYFRKFILLSIAALLMLLTPNGQTVCAEFDSTGAFINETTDSVLNNFQTINLNTTNSCKVLVTGSACGYDYETASRIANIGFPVDVVSVSEITPEILNQHGLVWIAICGAAQVEAEGKSEMIREYVLSGGGLIVEQPNAVGNVDLLPFSFIISNDGYEDPCTRNVIVPDHPLTQGLSPGLLPPAYDTVGSIGPEWEVLVEDGTGDPTLSVANYGYGKIIVELGNTSIAGCACGTCMDDIMIERMIEWACKSEIIHVSVDIKPGSCPNPITLKDQGVMPFAIMGTVEFDVTQIDPASIRLSREGVPGEVAPIRWSYEDVATPFEGELCNCHALKGDGIMDLALKVNAQAVIKTLKLAEVIGQTIPLTMTGKLKDEFGGTPITGNDCIRMLKK